MRHLPGSNPRHLLSMVVSPHAPLIHRQARLTRMSCCYAPAERKNPCSWPARITGVEERDAGPLSIPLAGCETSSGIAQGVGVTRSCGSNSLTTCFTRSSSRRRAYKSTGKRVVRKIYRSLQSKPTRLGVWHPPQWPGEEQRSRTQTGQRIPRRIEGQSERLDTR